MVYDNNNKLIRPKFKKEVYTADVLLDIMESYKKSIDGAAGKYPEAVLSDISVSLDFVLQNCERI